MHEYTCAMCHETFESERQQDEAEAEFVAMFGRKVNATDERVCHDCWLKLTGNETAATGFDRRSLYPSTEQ